MSLVSAGVVTVLVGLVRFVTICLHRFLKKYSVELAVVVAKTVIISFARGQVYANWKMAVVTLVSKVTTPAHTTLVCNQAKRDERPKACILLFLVLCDSYRDS